MTQEQTAPTPPAAPPPARTGWLEILGARSLRMVLVLVGLWILIAAGADAEARRGFLTPGNFSNLTAQNADIIIIGVGMTLVVCIRGIDLSVGAGIALAGVIAAKALGEHHLPALVAAALAIVALSVLGLWHSVLVSRLRIPAFIATLSGFLAYRGAALVLSGSQGLSLDDKLSVLAGVVPAAPSIALCVTALAVGLGLLAAREQRRRKLGLPGEGPVALAAQALGMLLATVFFAVIYQDGMPVPVLIAALAAGLGAVLLNRSRLGRYAFAIGGNAEAARLSGVPVERVTVAIYALTGVLTAVAGLVVAARTNGVTPSNAGVMRELNVVSAVVIGGTSLNGGRATMLGTVIGALIFGTLSNGMNMVGVNSNWQLILTGMILLGASMLDALSTNKRP